MITFLFRKLCTLFRISIAKNNKNQKTSLYPLLRLLIQAKSTNIPREFGKYELSQYDNVTVSSGVTGEIHFGDIFSLLTELKYLPFISLSLLTQLLFSFPKPQFNFILFFVCTLRRTF